MTSRTRRLSTIAALGVVGSAAVSRGAAVVDYNFINNPVPAAQPASVGPTALAGNATSSSITSGSGTGGAGAGNGGGTNGAGIGIDFATNGGYSATPATSGEFLRAFTNSASAQTTEAQSVSTACYWNFVVTPQNGAALNFTDISITGARGGGSTPRGFYVESSLENPGNAWGTKDIFGIGSEQSQRPSLTTYNVSNYQSFETGGANASSLGVGSLDLSTNPAYQNVKVPVEFRVYVIGPANGNSIDFTDFSVNGTVSTPEPVAFGLVGVGVVGLLVRRRRA